MMAKTLKRCFAGALLLAGGVLFAKVLLGGGETVALPTAAKEKEIVIGGSMPLSGVFSFAGAGADAGIRDYVGIVNESGGIEGHKLRYVPQDSGYEVDVSAAAFDEITGRNAVNFYYGDSTAFSKKINPTLNRLGTILMSGTSFATELNDPKKFPYQFLAGPDYTEMFGILLRYIAVAKPDARIAFVYSDTEFGRDPIATSRRMAEGLGLTVAAEIMTPPGRSDVSAEIARLHRVAPDYAIFHGYILEPIPQFIEEARARGLKTQFMGTFWTMDHANVMQMGEVAEGFLGVMPYNYAYDDSRPWPMLEKIRSLHPDYQTVAYIQGFLSAKLYAEAARRTLAAGKPPTAANLKAALNSIENFDTGGLIGIPITIRGNSIPVGRIYRADMAANRMVPVSDWIVLEQPQRR